MTEVRSFLRYVSDQEEGSSAFISCLDLGDVHPHGLQAQALSSGVQEREDGISIDYI